MKWLLLALLFILPLNAFTQESDSLSADASQVFLRLSIDCRECDNRYLRTEIDFVDHVRDQGESDVHLFVTRNRTGGGREYTMRFIGKGEFEAIQSTLRYNSNNTDSRDERRSGMLKVIKMGLMQFVSQTPLINNFRLQYRPPEGLANTQMFQKDPWDYWVFRLGFNGSFSGEDARNSIFVRGNLSVNRITELWKTRMWLNGDYRERNFKVEEDSVTTTVSSITKNGILWIAQLYGLNDHWSLGASTTLRSSTFDKIDFSASIAPAIEYNIFPYSEFSRREFRFLYRLNIGRQNYAETTIFDQTNETLFEQSFEMTLEIRQPWGDAEMRLEGSNYLHDFSKNRVEFYGELDFRLIKGLSLNISGDVSRIRDQLSLPKGDATEEEVLLTQRQLQQSYEYGISFGFRYTFGSIFNNIVNTRFGF